MPDYKRLVSYMYTYEEGKKRNNVGYTRVEARNGQCKFTIHVSALSYNDKQVTVYAFKRNKNQIEGIQLGKINFRNEVGDFRLVTDPNRILNTGYGIDDIGGIVLYNTSTKYLATVWDEYPLSMDMVASLESKDANIFTADANVVMEVEKEIDDAVKEAENEDKIAVTAVKKSTIVLSNEVINNDNIDNRTIDGVEDDIAYNKGIENVDSINNGIEQAVESDNNNVVENAAKSDNGIENVVKNENSQLNNKEVENKNNQASENVTNNVDSIIDGITKSTNQFVNSIEKENSMNKELTDTANSVDGNVHDLSRQENGCNCNNSQNQVKDNMNRNSYNDHHGNCTRSGLEESPIATKLYKEYPRMYPFEDSEVLWCVRIEPKDIGILPVDVWPLANNSFLLHGFYGHRHLIFAKVNNRNSNSYIIGVPGIYHNRERFMAKMFGFENFKCAKKRDRREGEFGYWYVPVNLKL